ncbi:molybdenum cofactor biosynthesis protein MoaE [Herbiconiux sp. L3-i23]|uniref:molybdenum cofactor biosynthesis protein MoaE n=1 Tax=Herbiconiux sp. L3-i23 TaxID=2905871 RepID=UPI00204A3297|nr:molybdenum cofactor biosynthesis protein MoaE [Herbiconiux sp. L3-i23]BDI21849.1 molybdopterin synthase catalytic subunit 2 [Herbiconiux sp. L3-i23]
MSVVLARVTSDVLDADELESAVTSRADGAVVTFRGVVRDADGGREVTALDYSAHPDAERILAECCAAVAAETGLTLAAAHRIGALAIGDVALVAVVASPHRAEAFAACALLVDRIKAETPIWKKQHYPDGASDWLGL